jgi:hypothetical protein
MNLVSDSPDFAKLHPDLVRVLRECEIKWRASLNNLLPTIPLELREDARVGFLAVQQSLLKDFLAAWDLTSRAMHAIENIGRLAELAEKELAAMPAQGPVQ